MAIFRGSGSSLTGSAIDPTEALLDSDFTVNGILVRTASGVYSTTPDNTANWDTAYSWGDHSAVGYTVGPSSSTDNAVVRFNGTTGELVQDSSVTINDSGYLTANYLAQLSSDGENPTIGNVYVTNTTDGFFRKASFSYFEGSLSITLSQVTDSGTAAAADLTTSATDTTAGRVLQVGAGHQQLDSDLYRKGNILGTVSQSSGVPTGAIIEQGSNSNGEYTKFADGTMICWLVELGLNQQTSNRLRNTWNYPAAFSGTPAVHITVADSSTPFSVENISGPRVPVSDSASATVDVYDSGATLTGGEALLVDVTATGRWF